MIRFPASPSFLGKSLKQTQDMSEPQIRKVDPIYMPFFGEASPNA
jgi:hypothetical protein